jgi:hypothetical protein
MITHIISVVLGLGVRQQPVARRRHLPTDDDELLPHKTLVGLAKQRADLRLPIALHLGVRVLAGTAVAGGLLKAQELSWRDGLARAGVAQRCGDGISGMEKAGGGVSALDENTVNDR